MKKILFLSVACLLFAGSQSSFAQTEANSQLASSSTIMQDFAQKKTNQVVNILARTNKLEADQQKKIYSIFASAEKKMNGIEAIEDASKKNAKRAKMQDYINSKLKTVLTEQQFKTYLENTIAK
ncbi:hypothetical protein ES692_08475 [Psychroserpens burtonensis]|uniref:DUF4168 domain-containing protein n=1 Tax=Psychroserpens burtonensis TaxID=49278 RepID=A0A5C7B6S0_9FLAO|nr:hypothetical protein [Psychroserpens burtonensis]TXE17592.1 hypothetical protein ES692_08475 [Psychroserpens burtonensis]